MNTDYTVKLFLDQRRKKKDGTYPIVLRVIIFGKTIDMSTGFNAIPKHWSNHDPYLKKSFGERYKFINRKLKSLQLEVETKMDSLLTNGRIDPSHSHKEIKNLLKKSDSNMTFDFFTDHIRSLKNDDKLGTARWYNTTLNAVKDFSKNNKGTAVDFPLSNISLTWLLKFEKWYLSRNKEERAINGLSVYMRALRAILNKAKQAGVLDETHNPFRNYKIKHKETVKRALTKDELKAFAKVECRTGWQSRSKNFFLASYFLYGMAFQDMCRLQAGDIKSNGRIEYKRAKTGKHLSIKLNSSLAEILKPYLRGKSKADFIFNVLREEQTEAQKYNAIKNAMKRCNKALRELAEECGIDQISTYSARHTFASHLLENKQPIEVISQMMGHKSIRTTQVYLKGFHTNVLDEAQDGLVTI